MRSYFLDRLEIVPSKFLLDGSLCHFTLYINSAQCIYFLSSTLNALNNIDPYYGKGECSHLSTQRLS